MTDRERAEQLWQKLTRLEAAQDAQDIYIAREYVDLIVAFSREERARAWEEARGLLLAQQCHEPFYGSAIYKQVVVDFARWIDKIAEMFGERARRVRDHVPNR